MRIRWLILLPSLVVIAFAALTLRLLLNKHFTIDEFQYAHAAWLVAHGSIPYRDFFDDRFPLLYQILGVFPALRQARPQDLILLRWAVLPIVVLIAVLIAFSNRRFDPFTALLGVAFLLATPAFTARATEIRPDALAFMLFLAAISLLSTRSVRDSPAAFFAGVLLAASVWASLKVVYYGCIVAIALLFPRRRAYLRNPPLFVAGFAVLCALVALYLVLSGSASDWFLWTVRWAWIHEREYPHFPWFTTALPFLRDSSWLLLLCLAGWITELRAGERDVLLLLALPSTLLSFAAQRAPFEYSLIPFIGIAVIFAARGVAALVNVRNRVLTAAVAFVCAAGMAADVPRTFQAAIPSNDAQLATLTRLGMATAPNDAVYDNTGAYFARPNAWYFFYTDEVLRRRLFSTMTIEVEEALRRTQAPAILIDLRFRGLPPRLQAFLLEHYQPYFGDLRLWGMRFGPAASVDAQFWAIRDGEYFVYPNTTLLVDGQAVTTGIVRLRAGPHRVVFSGKPAAFALLWLPRDGKPYVPSSSPAPNVFSDL